MSVYKLKRKTGSNTTEDIQLDYNTCIANKPYIPIYVEGATTGTSPIWTATSSDITSYENGMIIAFKIGIAGLSGTQTTLNINNLGAKKVYENVSTNPSTHYSVGTILIMTYDASADSNAGAWKIAGDRVGTDSQNVRTYNYTGSNYDRDLICRQDTASITDGSYTAKYVASTTKASINTSTGKITAGGFAVTNGTSSQFLKADGSTDSNTYQSALPTTSTAGKVLKSTSTAGTVEWGDVQAGSSTDVQINGTSIVSNGVANILTNTAYNSSSNKIATMSDIPTTTSSVTNGSTAALTSGGAYTALSDYIKKQNTNSVASTTTINSTTPAIFTLNRQTSGGGAFIDYFGNNQTTTGWRAGCGGGLDFEIYSSASGVTTKRLGVTTAGKLLIPSKSIGDGTYTYTLPNKTGTVAMTSDVPSVWSGTQAQYDAIANKDSNTYYFIQEE